jgi:hypothetical protein
MDTVATVASLLGQLAVPAAALLVAGGLPLLATGFLLWRAARSEPHDLERALLIARGFRRAVIGLCAVVFGAAWLTDVGWLMGIAAIVAGEETLESSVHVAALRDGCVRARREREGAQAAIAAA